ncbi:exodeoxyribonuclease VII large subunit [Candidatus Berkelbacteria bacterium]|nr:exodeoxyribonuclease VII large subunit [Candidatus Berkelbacteria bacterium]
MIGKPIAPVVFSVTQANELVNATLGNTLGPIQVTGEVSDYQLKRGTWISFTLKDEKSRVSCFTHVRTMSQPLEDGLQVNVLATPRLYVPFGTYSLSLISVETVGAGSLRRAYELLIEKLNLEGLFAQDRKRPLPRFPSLIGLITSAEGAALHDVLKVLTQRWEDCTVLLYPVAVQGRDAVPSILEALAYFNGRPHTSVVILTRGGGSLEDLQAFNDERLARAVAASRIPTIVAVGHESDTSIAELVADVRAATPSHAMQLAVPDRETIALTLDRQATLIEHSISERLDRAGRALERTIMIGQRVQTRCRYELERQSNQLTTLAHQWAERLKQSSQLLSGWRDTATRACLAHTTVLQLKLTQLEARITQLSPATVLARGYSYTVDSQSGTMIRSTRDVLIGQVLSTHLSDGTVTSEVIHGPA